MTTPRLAGQAGPDALQRAAARLPTACPPLPRDAGQHRLGARRLERWDRIGLGIRMAFNPQRADVIRVWLGLGQQLARDGCGAEAALLLRALALLLHTARDPALPLSWRHACLQHTARPLARLVTLLGPPGQTEALALHDLVQQADQLLEAAPRC